MSDEARPGADGVNLRRLTEMLVNGDDRMPAIVFVLLARYYDRGPFPFDAAALAETLSGKDNSIKLNPTQVADLQHEIERYFEPGPDGRVPRPGVLAA